MLVHLVYKLTNGNDITPIYAYTTKLKVLTKFLEIRNPEIFRFRDVEMDDEQFAEFEYKHIKSKIKKYDLVTRDMENNPIKIKFLCTEREYMKIDSRLIMLTHARIKELIDLIPYRLLKNEYRNALNAVLFDYYKDSFDAVTVADRILIKNKIDIQYDELGILLLVLKEEFSIA